MAEVYYNLHKNCLSIRDKGRVTGHAKTVLLKDCKFVVQPAGNRRVRETGRKNVHAFVRGRIVHWDAAPWSPPPARSKWRRATYNPYKYTTFVDRETGDAILESPLVLILDKQVYYKEPEC